MSPRAFQFSNTGNKQLSMVDSSPHNTNKSGSLSMVRAGLDWLLLGFQSRLRQHRRPYFDAENDFTVHPDMARPKQGCRKPNSIETIIEIVIEAGIQ